MPRSLIWTCLVSHLNLQMLANSSTGTFIELIVPKDTSWHPCSISSFCSSTLGYKIESIRPIKKDLMSSHFKCYKAILTESLWGAEIRQWCMYTAAVEFSCLERLLKLLMLWRSLTHRAQHDDMVLAHDNPATRMTAQPRPHSVSWRHSFTDTAGLTSGEAN
jgi:hypothetical protein